MWLGPYVKSQGLLTLDQWVTNQRRTDIRVREVLRRALKLAIPPGCVVVKVEDLRGVGGKVEGVETGQGCPACYRLRSKGHAPDCWIGRAIGGGE